MVIPWVFHFYLHFQAFRGHGNVLMSKYQVYYEEIRYWKCECGVAKMPKLRVDTHFAGRLASMLSTSFVCY